jgi:hypothetical protein
MNERKLTQRELQTRAILQSDKTILTLTANVLTWLGRRPDPSLGDKGWRLGEVLTALVRHDDAPNALAAAPERACYLLGLA